jgi:hypothetical protein
LTARKVAVYCPNDPCTVTTLVSVVDPFDAAIETLALNPDCTEQLKLTLTSMKPFGGMVMRDW